MPSNPVQRPSARLKSGNDMLRCVCEALLTRTVVTSPVECEGCDRTWHTRVDITRISGQGTPPQSGIQFNA